MYGVRCDYKLHLPVLLQTTAVSKFDFTEGYGPFCHVNANNVLLIHLQEWNITRLSYEYDSEPFGKERDAAIKKLASEASVEVTVRISHTLYDLDKYVPRQAAITTTTITEIKELCQFILSVLFLHFIHLLFSLSFFFFSPHSVRIIELNGGQSPLTYKRFQTLISRMEAVETPTEAITAEVMGSCTTPLSDDHDEKFGVPSLEELGEALVL